MATPASDRPVVIVTGYNGFIGSVLVKRLAKRFRVIGFDRDLPPYHPADAECVCIDFLPMLADEPIDARRI